MSTTTVLKLTPGKGCEDLEELSNSHGSAPVIWNETAKRYLGAGDHGYMLRIDELWPVYKRPDIPTHHRSVLLMTYDRAMVMREHYARAAQDIRAWLVDFPPKPGYANHWARIAEIFESSPDCPAIGFYMTSVTENLFLGDYNEEQEDYDPVNWDQCWSVYAVADQLSAA